MRVRDTAQESPVFAQQKALFLRKFIILAPKRVSSQTCAVGFVFRKRRNVIDPIGQRG